MYSILQKRLQSRKELLRQLSVMYGTFLGENACSELPLSQSETPFSVSLPTVYSETTLPRTRNSLPIAQEEEDKTSRIGVNRFLAPRAQLNTALPDEASVAGDVGFYGNGDKRASGGGMVVPVIQRVTSSGEVEQCSSGIS